MKIFYSLLLVFALSISTFSQNANKLVICEIYAGGGETSGASPYTRDYVILYNPTATAITMTDWSIQYGGPSGGFNNYAVGKINGTVAPYSYFFIVTGITGTVGGNHPMYAVANVDLGTAIDFSSSGGKVVLVKKATTIGQNPPTGNNYALDTSVVNFVGYGSSNSFRGTGTAGGVGYNSTKSVKRYAWNSTLSQKETVAYGGLGMGYDKDDNKNDFYMEPADNAPLPVELTSFVASVNGTVVSLNWATATELNNKGFEVERKTNGSDFTTVGFVAGKGTTTDANEYSFSDKISAGTYTYRLRQVDFDGSFEYSNEINVDVTGVNSFELAQNYPNPFNPSTKISFSLAKDSDVKLSVFNTLGEEVAVLINSTLTAGNHSVDFNATNLTSGMYLYKIQAGEFVSVKKMNLVK